MTPGNGWKPQPQLMTQFVKHCAEGQSWQCTRCGFHRKNRLIHHQRYRVVQRNIEPLESPKI